MWFSENGLRRFALSLRARNIQCSLPLSLLSRSFLPPHLSSPFFPRKITSLTKFWRATITLLCRHSQESHNNRGTMVADAGDKQFQQRGKQHVAGLACASMPLQTYQKSRVLGLVMIPCSNLQGWITQPILRPSWVLDISVHAFPSIPTSLGAAKAQFI